MTDAIANARAEGRTTLTEAESKRLLGAAGVETPAFRVVDADSASQAAEATLAADAARAAADVGFPVALKVSGPDITHKSEWADGAGVALGLASRDAVRDAADRVLAAASDGGHEVALLVEEMRDAGDGTEVVVGGVRDPSFGPVVLTGLGGVFTEIYADTRHRLAPVTDAEALGAIEELTAAPLLAGYRGRPAADRAALASVVTAVGDLLVDRPAIAEIDVNPVLATPGGAVALDALVVLEE